MTAPRIQHLISSTAVLIVALLVTWISFTQQPSEAFLFPRLISVFFSSLAIWNFVRAAGGMARVGEGMNMPIFMNLLPGTIIMLVYVFFASKVLGFYLASTITFLAIFTLYDSTPLSDAKGWGKRLVITLAFMTLIYGLFALLLKVQTPRGIWL
ncbi:MAG: tripartite tricarboxylate transporter TctB family protein [Rhizobiaceae bacterium]